MIYVRVKTCTVAPLTLDLLQTLCFVLSVLMLQDRTIPKVSGRHS
jgi:hypothetical protein